MIISVELSIDWAGFQNKIGGIDDHVHLLVSLKSMHKSCRSDAGVEESIFRVGS